MLTEQHITGVLFTQSGRFDGTSKLTEEEFHELFAWTRQVVQRIEQEIRDDIASDSGTP